MGSLYFDVAEPLDHATFLSICNEVLRDSLLVLAPFGLPRHLRQALGSEKEFVRQYGPRFRLVLEAVSDATYREHGVSESEVAVTLHKYTEEEQSPEAIAYLSKMSDSLQALYSPPRVLELPAQAPSSSGDLVSIGSSLLKAGAVYAPEPPQQQPVFFSSRAEKAGSPSFCGDGGVSCSSRVTEPGSGAGCGGGTAPAAESAVGCYCAAASPLQETACVACQARSSAAGYYSAWRGKQPQKGGGGGGGGGGGVGVGAVTVAASEEGIAGEDSGTVAAQQQQQLQQLQQLLLLRRGAAESEKAGAAPQGDDESAVAAVAHSGGGGGGCPGVIRHGASVNTTTAAATGGGNHHLNHHHPAAEEGAYSEKVLSAKVASCLSALKSSQKELEVFTEELEQAHMQALTEAFAARYLARPTACAAKGCGGACTCSSPPPRRDEGPDGSRRRCRSCCSCCCCDAAALDEFASVPFLENELFVLVRGLQRLCSTEGKEGGQEEKDVNAPTSASGTWKPLSTRGRGGDGDGGGGGCGCGCDCGCDCGGDISGGEKNCDNPEASLECVLTSLGLRLLAEQSFDRGLDEQAAAYFEEAISALSEYGEEEEGGEGGAFGQGGHRLPRPRRYLAELRAGAAKCELRRGEFEAASARAERALDEHASCGEAFLVRGKCRRELGDTEGALSDLVKAFVLRGSALSPGDDGGGEAQTIEDVSRENSREKAGEKFSLREAPNALPADWVVRTFLASYDTEELYAEHDRITSQGPLDDANGPSLSEAKGGEGGAGGSSASFWQGLTLVREGKFAESVAKFSAAAAAAADDADDADDADAADAADADADAAADVRAAADAAADADAPSSGTTAAVTGDPRVQSLALEYYGSFLYLMGDIDGSLEHLSRATEVDATNAKSWVKKGSVLSDLGHREEAFECFDAAEAIDPRDSDLFLHRGQGHLLANDFRAATIDLRRSVELCPTMPISRAAWGVALFKLATAEEMPSPSSLAKCLQVLEDARERFPDSPEVLFFFAEVLISMGDFRKGLECLKQASSADPECPIPYVNAARGYLAMNDTSAARRRAHMISSSELDPTYPGTCLDLGQLLMQEGAPAEALSMYARGVEKARFPSELHDAMACLDVAKAHLSAQQLFHRGPTIAV
ncbi:unnamed protein product [Pylaiella littoralis]